MAQHQFRVAEVEVSHSPTDEKILAFYRYDSPHPNRKGSTTLIVAEITSTLYSYERLLDVLNSTTDQLRHLTAAVEQDPISRFEKLVQRINESLTIFLRGEATPLSWSRVSIYIIDLCEGQMCITGIGRLMNIFLQKQEDGSFKSFDLLGSLEQPAEFNPEKPFTSLICGDIKPGDILIIGSTNFERLRHELAIRDRLIASPPVSAAMEIKQDLEYRGIPDDFLAVIVSCAVADNTGVPPAPPRPVERDLGKSTASIYKLRETEQETHNNLSPALRPSASSSSSTASQGQFTAKATAGMLGLIKKARAAIGQRVLQKDPRTMASLRGMNAGHGNRFSRQQTIMASGIGLALVAVITGALIWRNSARRATAEAAWQSTFDKALDNRNRAESDLVYANDTRARSEINDAASLVAPLEAKEPEHAQKLGQLKSDLDQLRERLRKLMAADPLTELVALNGVPDGTLTAPVITKDAAYAADNSTHSVIRVNLKTKESKRIQLPETSDPIVAGSLGKQSVVFTTGKGKLFAVDAQTNEVIALNSQIKSSSTTDIALYAGRMYRLDGPAGQLWRGQAALGSGFSSEAQYIKAANSVLTGAVSVAIDSNVYILTPDGNLARFLSGGQDGFTLNAVDPPLRAASGIWTNADAERLVITDPAGKRVIVFNKDGTLKAQLTSSQFTAPRDVDGDNANHRLLIIDGTRLLLTTLP